MISETEQVYSKTIDHLGLVAATIHDIGLIEKIDNLIPIFRTNITSFYCYLKGDIFKETIKA